MTACSTSCSAPHFMRAAVSEQGAGRETPPALRKRDLEAAGGIAPRRSRPYSVASLLNRVRNEILSTCRLRLVTVAVILNLIIRRKPPCKTCPPPPDFDELSVEERSLSAVAVGPNCGAPETVPPDRHRVIQPTAEDLEASPESGDSWDVVQERLRTRLDEPH